MAKKRLPYDSPYETRVSPSADDEDLTNDNCSPEAWEALGGDIEIPEHEMDKFAREFLEGDPTKGL
jgi:hypothetical protein